MERHTHTLSDRSAELRDLRKQLSDTQQQLRNAQRLNAAATQDGHLETAELRAMLSEKDALINVRLLTCFTLAFALQIPDLDEQLRFL